MFHDALVESIEVGPRREVKLVLRTENPPARPTLATVRCGAIENFETVSAFFASLPERPSPTAYRARVDSITGADSGAGSSALRTVVVSLDGSEPIEIRCRKVSVVMRGAACPT